jgi:hypothetical protein
VQREIYFREHGQTGNTAGSARRRGDEINGRFATRPPLTAEDIRIHTWLIERLAAVDHERHGLWPRLRRFLFGNRYA